MRRDITGERFGRLVVLGRAGMDGVKSLWRCRCDCGAERVVLGQSLRQGYTRSCGCLRRETSRENGRHFRARARAGGGVWEVWR